MYLIHIVAYTRMKYKMIKGLGFRFHKTVLLNTRLVHYFIQDLHNKIGKNPKLLSYGPEPWVGYIMRSLNIPA